MLDFIKMPVISARGCGKYAASMYSGVFPFPLRKASAGFINQYYELEWLRLTISECYCFRFWETMNSFLAFQLRLLGATKEKNVMSNKHVKGQVWLMAVQKDPQSWCLIAQESAFTGILWKSSFCEHYREYS